MRSIDKHGWQGWECIVSYHEISDRLCGSVVWAILFESGAAVIIRETERISPGRGRKSEGRESSATKRHLDVCKECLE
jgi:hypothetical protein